MASKKESLVKEEAPEILDLRTARSRRRWAELKKGKPFLVDEIDEQERELSAVRDPRRIITRNFSKAIKTSEVWVFYPWRNCMVHILPRRQFDELRRSRNFNLILPKEQAKLEQIRVGIAGLNVGNPAAVCLALEGVHRFRLADFDPLSVSNLNRFRAGLPDLGVNKAILTARQIWEINPFAEIELWNKGVTPGESRKFLSGLDVIVEEMDNLPLKVEMREQARELKLPVVMVTGNAENVIIDVERYDLNRHLKILNGHLKSPVIARIKKLASYTPFAEKLSLARDFMGVRHLRPRLVASFREVGRSLAGIPQIAESSFLRGAAVAYTVRRLATGAKVPSGRYNLRVDTIFHS